ncbi:MAG: SusC/RagA family TonB-linked outer membrane protein [Muribaculaceae bacterium]|nr:SusC/RagA family TonB-linked outer membrane protein [Muribaculaceae bacterium]
MRKLFLILVTLMLCGWTAMAQNATYRGTVLDAANNQPLIGATISPIGGGQGTAADIDGHFTLTVPQNVTQAKVSYVGFADQVVTLSNNMTVYLDSKDTALQDVVVVAYGTANKESLTGSVAVVGSKEIEERPVTSVTTALEGNAPGVMVNNATTQPGESASIRVRGFSSINGNNSALIILDGTEYVGDIAALNPNDIESMSVLKDAASCALYGNRGANGVVLITTKKAKRVGKVDVTLQIRQGAYERGLPFYDRLDADDWMQTTFNALVNGSVSGQNWSRQQSIDYWKENYIPGFAMLNIYDKANNQLFDSNGVFNATRKAGYNSKDMDWWDGVSRTGHRQEYSVSMAGATEKFNAFASGSYMKENGYVLLTDFERFNGRVNLNANPVSFLRVGLNLNAAQTESQRSPLDSDNLGVTINPFSMTANKAPIYPYYLHDENGNIVYSDGEPVWNQESYNSDGNIVWNIREDRRNYSVTMFDASLYGTIVLPYGFDLTVKGAMFRDKTNEMEYANNKIGSQMNVGSYSKTYYTTSTHTFSQMLNWEHDYGDHHVDALLSHENYAYDYTENFDRKSGQELPDNIHMGNFSEMMDMTAYAVGYKSESYLARARYNYNQKYYGEVSVRRDGSSRFAKEDRWGTFWSVGGSWIISKEKFLHDANWINFLKLRASYGSVGNDMSAGYYAYWGLYNFGWSLAGSTNVLVPSQLAPSGLKWEATKTLDVALEGSLFNDRFNFSIGYYNKRNTDLLFWVKAPGSAGSLGNTGTDAQVLKNIGTMQNIGWELQFGVDIIRTKDWKWDFKADASFLKNKIVKLPDNQHQVGDGLFIGKSLYERYTYEFAGVDQLTGNALYELNPHSPDYYYYDEDGVWTWDEEAATQAQENAANNGALVQIGDKYYTTRTTYAGRKLMGTALPTVFGSFGTSVGWKGINLSLLFTYSLGGKLYDGNYAGYMSVGASSRAALHKDLLKSWTGAPEGMTEDSPNRIDKNGIPALDTNTNSYNNSASSRWLVDNNYMTLKNINLSYDFPAKWVSALKMQSLNLGFAVDNAFIITARKGINPQYNFSGGQGNYFVPARVYSFQLTAKF